MGRSRISSVALKIGLAGAVGVGVLVTGFIASRQGRRLLREAWEGRMRTRLEDRVLDALWADPLVGRRRIDALEVEDGLIELSGRVRSETERERAVEVAESLPGVAQVSDRLAVQARQARLPG
jgi:hypothetical protein